MDKGAKAVRKSMTENVGRQYGIGINKETIELWTNLLISSTVYLFHASCEPRVVRQSSCKLPVSIQPYKPPQAFEEVVPIKTQKVVMNWGRS